MKKSLFAVICALLVCWAAGCAQTAEPQMPEKLRGLVAGKTHIACLEGYAADEAMAHVSLSFVIYEQETYQAQDVQALAPGDTLTVGGEPFRILSIKQDEYGYEVTGETYDLFLYPNEDGLYYAVSDTEHRFYAAVAAIEVPAPADLRFVDGSDPEAEEATVGTLQDLLDRYGKEEINSSADNTEITFDEEGRLTEIVYRYSPWN